jgi:hypothetical protein
MSKKAFDAKVWREERGELIKQMGDWVRQEVRTYEEDPEKLAEYLRTSARFYRYSARNRILIGRQNRFSTFVASFPDWKAKGWPVLKGAQGIKIFVPVTVTYIDRGDGSQPVQFSLASSNEK